jgi:hypothetical protein
MLLLSYSSPRFWFGDSLAFLVFKKPFDVLLLYSQATRQPRNLLLANEVDYLRIVCQKGLSTGSRALVRVDLGPDNRGDSIVPQLVHVGIRPARVTVQLI